MYRIDVSNCQSIMRVNARRLRDGARRALEWERVPDAAVSIVVLNDAGIRRLNRRFLEHDEPTDVLSFLLDREGPPGLRRAHRIEGELFVSAETAVRRAPEFGWQPCWELLLYVVHGALHLCGYDDRTPAQRRQMQARQSTILRNWGMTISYSSGRSRPRLSDD